MDGQTRKLVIGVMGGADVGAEVCALALELGKRIAERGWVLLNGGRDAGVMAASSKGAKQSGGTVIGILPDRDVSRASPDLDYAIVTGMGDARNLINVLSSDLIIACPGGAGTMSEVALGLKCGKRVILLGWNAGGAFEEFRVSGLLTRASDPDDAIRQAAEVLDQRGRDDPPDAHPPRSRKL